MELSFFISANILAALILLIVAASILKTGEDRQKPLSNLSFGICLFIAADTAFLLLSGNPGRVYPAAAFSAKSVYYIMNAFIVCSWSDYAAHIVYEEDYWPTKIRHLYVAMLLINVLIVLVNLFFPVMFGVGDKGELLVYPAGMWIYTILNFSMPVISFICVLMKRKSMPKRILRQLVLFPVLPALAEVLRPFFPNVDLICFYGLSALFFLVIQREYSLQRDRLTGLYNRTLLTRKLDNWLKNEEDRKRVTGILIDVDGMGKINEKYGHETGDRVLQHVADLLRNLPFQELFPVRYDGDEFLLLFRRSVEDEAEEIIGILERRKEEMNRHLPESERFHLRLDSFTCPDAEGIRSEKIFLSLDEKYKRPRHEIDDIIDEALKERSFEVWYQPIFSARSGAYPRAEALLRLPRGTEGVWTPGTFIPAAEESGAIVKLGEYVIRDVCRFIKSETFRVSGFERIEINLSVRQLQEIGEADAIIRIIDQEGISHDKLGFELTESVAANEEAILRENLRRLKAAGFSFSLDDFGSGFSNLQRLMTLPFETVKFDKSLSDNAFDSREQILLRSLISMLREMGLTVLMEGIEEKRQADLLISYGCDFIQGYYYARPMPERNISRWKESIRE